MDNAEFARAVDELKAEATRCLNAPVKPLVDDVRNRLLSASHAAACVRTWRWSMTSLCSPWSSLVEMRMVRGECSAMHRWQKFRRVEPTER